MTDAPLSGDNPGGRFWNTSIYSSRISTTSGEWEGVSLALLESRLVAKIGVYPSRINTCVWRKSMKMKEGRFSSL